MQYSQLDLFRFLNCPSPHTTPATLHIVQFCSITLGNRTQSSLHISLFLLIQFDHLFSSSLPTNLHAITCFWSHLDYHVATQVLVSHAESKFVELITQCNKRTFQVTFEVSPTRSLRTIPKTTQFLVSYEGGYETIQISYATL